MGARRAGRRIHFQSQPYSNTNVRPVRSEPTASVHSCKINAPLLYILTANEDYSMTSHRIERKIQFQSHHSNTNVLSVRLGVATSVNSFEEDNCESITALYMLTANED